MIILQLFIRTLTHFYEFKFSAMNRSIYAYSIKSQGYKNGIAETKTLALGNGSSPQ